MLTGPDGVALGLGLVEDHEPPAWPNQHGTKQFHLDLAVDDLDAAAAECVAAGATLPDDQPGETWRVLLDPSGHPFCLTQAANWAEPPPPPPSERQRVSAFDPVSWGSFKRLPRPPC